MRKLATLTLAVALVALSAAVVFAAGKPGANSGSPVGTTETQTTDTTTTPNHDQAVNRHHKRGHRKRGHHKHHVGRHAGNRVRHAHRAAGTPDVPGQPDDTPGDVREDQGGAADDTAEHHDGEHADGNHQDGEHQNGDQLDNEHGNPGPSGDADDDVAEGDHSGGGENSGHGGGAND